MPPILDIGDEVHGVADSKMGKPEGWVGRQQVTIIAWGHLVSLDTASGYPAGLSPAQARYLADKLYHVADLVEQRLGKPKESKP